MGERDEPLWTKGQVVALIAALVLGVGGGYALGAAGEDEPLTATATVTDTTTKKKTRTETTTTTTTVNKTVKSEFQKCYEQTGNADFCANPPPGE